MATNQLLMIRPIQFDFNVQTAVNNAFQQAGNNDGSQVKALQEFDVFLEKLLAEGVEVTVINDTPEPHTPDSIFPNNWISFHEDGTLVLYPMFAENRRQERKLTVLDEINKKFEIKQTIDLTNFENKNQFLEGTGSMVLDRENKLAYACISPRTNEALLNIFCEKMNYKPILFNAVDCNGNTIYHTNVLMCVTDNHVVICIDAISNLIEKNKVENYIKNSNKILIEISLEQMNCFAGNMLQVKNKYNENILVMSEQAYKSLNNGQKEKLLQHNAILHSNLQTIETNGGGSARCMMAEVYLSLK